jgi:hypothetical protein
MGGRPGAYSRKLALLELPSAVEEPGVALPGRILVNGIKGSAGLHAGEVRVVDGDLGGACKAVAAVRAAARRQTKARYGLFAAEGRAASLCRVRGKQRMRPETDQ